MQHSMQHVAQHVASNVAPCEGTLREMRLVQIDEHGVIVLAQRSSNELGRLRMQIVDYDVDFIHAFDFV